MSTSPHYDLYNRQACGSCDGAGRVKTGEPLGTCDGPQYGSCSRCNGTGKEFVAVKLVINIEDRPQE